MIQNQNDSNYDWKIISHILTAFILGITVCFLAFKTFYSGKEDFNSIKIEIVQDSVNTQKAIKSKLDSVLTLKLQNDIQLVEKKNDGRFEVLTWSSVLVLTLLLVFITINFLISSAKVRELVDIEIDKKTDDIKKKAKKFTKSYKAQILEMETITNEAKKESKKINDLIAEAEQLFKIKK